VTVGLDLPFREARAKVMTTLEVYELTTQGGRRILPFLFELVSLFGPYCLIGSLAVNCYVEPVYTLDADIVVLSSVLGNLTSVLRVQFITDERYQGFLTRSVEAEVLGMRVKIACLEDVTQGKLWAFDDPRRRLSKRKKDELDLFRLAEAYPRLKSVLPSELQDQIEKG
jgi:hypothetical protein